MNPAAANSSIFACEISGLASSSSFDVASSGFSSAAGNVAAAPFTTTANDFVILGVEGYGTGTTFTAGGLNATSSVTTASTDPPFVAGDVGKKLFATTNCDTL